jgi:hypothetical protein
LLKGGAHVEEPEAKARASPDMSTAIEKLILSRNSGTCLQGDPPAGGTRRSEKRLEKDAK